MNNSAEKNNSEVFPGNKTGEIHCRKSLISPSNKKKKKKKNTTHQKTKQKLNKNLQSQKICSVFEAGDWEVCFQLQAEETSVNKDQAKKGLDRSLKIWEHMQTEIWFTLDII